MNTRATINILGVKVDCLRLPEMLELVASWALQQQQRSVFYANAHSLNLADQDAQFHAVLNQGDLVYADGIGPLLASRLLGGCRLEKNTGADWVQPFCERALVDGLRCYILAGRPGVAQRAAQRLLERWPGLQLVGSSDGYFEEQAEPAVLQAIRQAAPHVLFVGMGSPLQERWIATHHAELGVPVCWAVGALFDYLAGRERRVPRWLYVLGLEWLWRLLMDPLGKWRRYLLGNPLFLYRVLRQRWRRQPAD